MIERLLLEGQRLSQATRAVERYMDQSARNLRRSGVGTPELLFALLDDPVVASVFESIDLPKETVIETMEKSWSRMRGVAPEPPTPPPSRSFLRRPSPSSVEPAESDPTSSLALDNVVARASRNVTRQGKNEVEPIDLLQALIEHEPSAINGMLFEDSKFALNLDKKAMLAAIKIRQEIPRVFFETTGRVDNPN